MRKRISNRAFWVAVAVFLFPHSGAGHQDKNQASNNIASQGTPDRFIGVWKLRVDKTQSAGTLSQVITIEDQGKDYRFTYDLAVSGKENHLSYVTDMKGETEIHAKGRTTSPWQIANYPHRFQQLQSRK